MWIKRPQCTSTYDYQIVKSTLVKVPLHSIPLSMHWHCNTSQHSKWKLAYRGPRLENLEKPNLGDAVLESHKSSHCRNNVIANILTDSIQQTGTWNGREDVVKWEQLQRESWTPFNNGIHMQLKLPSMTAWGSERLTSSDTVLLCWRACWEQKKRRHICCYGSCWRKLFSKLSNVL